MITIKDFMEVTNYRITEGSEYCWQSYGPNAHQFDSWNGINGKGGHTICMVFDTKTQVVYQFEAWDYNYDRCYRWINPNFIDEYKQECIERGCDYEEAFDEIKFIDIEVAEDILKKARAIVAGEEYDTRIDMPLRLDDDALFELMKRAHERDITLNQLVEDILRNVISLHETGTDDPIDFPMRDEYDFSDARQGPVIQSPPFPPDNFTQEQAREAVKKAKRKKSKK